MQQFLKKIPGNRGLVFFCFGSYSLYKRLKLGVHGMNVGADGFEPPTLCL